MPTVELLVPVGNELALRAAVQNGADAVYLAGKQYGARAFAGNFDDKQIVEAIKYCHYHEVKVYVTMNTVCFPSEIETAFLYAKFLAENNVDALIIQDFGLLEVLRKRLPNLVLHASTQMHLHNINSIKVIKSMGIKRVVVARETPIELVKEMTKLGIEIEIFVFGALCVCYSGQCYMSIINGTRSGNRGECAQPCRLKYQMFRNNEEIPLLNDYLISPRDLNTLDRTSELIEAGVSSFKIEGRMKRPEYVAQVTKEYRNTLDAYYSSNKYKTNVTDLKKLHNREFTTGYLFSQKNHEIVNAFRPNHIGIPLGEVVGYSNKQVFIKLLENINQQDAIRILDTVDSGLIANKIYKNGLLVNKALKGDTISFDFDKKVKIGSKVVLTSDSKQLDLLNESFMNPTRKTSVKTEFYARIGEQIKLKCTFQGHKVEVNSEEKVQKAEKQPISNTRILEQLTKINEFPFVLDHIDLFTDENIFISVKTINELRREAIKQIKALIGEPAQIAPQDYYYEIKPENTSSTISVTVNTMEQYEVAKTFPYDIYTDNQSLFESLSSQNINIGYVTSRVNENDENISAQKLYVNELGQIFTNKNSYLTSSHYFNITNAYAVGFMQELGFSKICLSTELDFEKTEKLVYQFTKINKETPNLEIFAYGHRDAMITKLNLIEMYGQNFSSDSYSLVQNGKSYPISIDSKSKTRILEPKPYNLINELENYKRIGINNFSISFTVEDKKEVERILRSIN